MWQPSASITTLKKRAAIIIKIRQFFAARDVLEVETPLLCRHTVTDPYIESIPATLHIENQTKTYYLQTSPEYAMKRLLAAGSGAIFQICKAFRQDQTGALHNSEFTMLEWYRPGFDHHALMQEMSDLLQDILSCEPAEKLSYQTVFEKYLAINPHIASVSDLQVCAKQHDIKVTESSYSHDIWLQLLFTHCIEHQLGHNKPCLIYDFPASQAALAKLQPNNPPLAARFEVYVKGIELANGFHELQSASEQKKRFEKNNIDRKNLALTTVEIDPLFLSSLKHGLPDCAGVALGLDRLIMLATNNQQLKDVLSFDAKNS